MLRGPIMLAAGLLLAAAGCTASSADPSAGSSGADTPQAAESGPQPTGSPSSGSAYNNATEIQATLGTAGHACKNPTSGNLIRGATDSSMCSSTGTWNLDTQIVVFNDHTAATAFAATAVATAYGLVTKTTALVGQNWVLTTTSPTYAQTAQGTLGGSIVSPRPKPAPTATPPPVTQQVEYRCTGSAPEGITITYGPDGFYYSASHLPFEHTDPLDASPPNHYYVTAQLQGSGSVSCTTTVTYDDGTGQKATAIKTATATGGHSTGTAIVCNDPYGGWQPC